jgi:putative tryptophan/tyrosine transport system substrate-binding protein
MNKAAVPSVLVWVLLLLAVAIKAEAQQLPKVPRIGILEPATSSSIAARIEAFRQGLRELGYVEGKNITIEYRYADGKSERIPDLAAELVNLKVDLIVTS